MRGRQAARKQRELAEAGAGRRGAAGLNGSWRGRTCPAAIRIWRATAALAGFLPASGELGVELVPGVRGSPGVLGGFDGGPAQGPRAGLGERAGARAVAGLADLRRQAGVADQLARGAEARDVADLRREREPEQVADAGDRVEQDHARV